MKKKLCIAALFVVFVCPLVCAEPFAPKLDLPPILGADPEKAAEVPEKGAVGIPPYPEAGIDYVQKAGDKELAKIVLLSNDEADKVAAFYRDALPGWKVQEIDKEVFQYWEGGRFPDPQGMMGKPTPFVGVYKITIKNHPRYPKEAKTTIEIYFSP